MNNLQRCYSEPRTPFGALGRFYDSLGHRGDDWKLKAGSGIVAYDDMRVEYIGRTPGLGMVMGCRRLTLGGWAGFAHIKNPVPVGSVISLGDGLARVAGEDDDPGTLWDGDHIHTTVSWVSAYNAAQGIRPLVDPRPSILDALERDRTSSRPAGEALAPVKESEMPLFFPYQKSAKAGQWWRVRPAEPLRMQANVSGTQNLAPAAGFADITLHVYGSDLTEGKALDVILKWRSPEGKESPHYVHRIHGAGDGIFRENVSFKRVVPAGFLVVCDIVARGGDVLVELTGADTAIYQ